MLKNEPLVSILVATYNSSEYISDCLNSLLDQTYNNIEIVVCDDASTDNTVDIVNELKKIESRIQLFVNEKNLGITLNMNNGIHNCNGKYIAILDGDDWSYPERIAKQVKVMEDDPEIVLCSSFMQICDENLNPVTTRKYPLSDNDIRKAMVRYNPISHPGSMWRAETLKKTSLYNNHFPIARDYDLIVRISEFGKYQNIPEVLIKYRVRNDSETAKRIRQTQWYSFYIQMKAHFEYGFPLKMGDIFFITARIISTIILPAKLQRNLANNFTNISAKKI